MPQSNFERKLADVAYTLAQVFSGVLKGVSGG